MAARGYISSRPCPQCGREVDLTNVTPGGQTFCRNVSDHATGRKQVLRRTLLPPAWRAELAAIETAAAAAVTADPATTWDAELPGVLDWPGPLGPACPDLVCDTCGCDSPPTRYTADHTATVCPECGPECWNVSEAAYRRGDAHAKATAPTKRPGTAGGPTLPEAWAIEKARRRQRDELLARIDAALAFGDYDPATRSDLGWYLEKISDRAITTAELDQAAADLVWLPDLDDLDQADDEPDDDEVAGEWEPPRPDYGPPPATGARVLPFAIPAAAQTWGQLRIPASGQPGWSDADYQQETARRLAQQQTAPGSEPTPSLWDLRR